LGPLFLYRAEVVQKGVAKLSRPVVTYCVPLPHMLISVPTLRLASLADVPAIQAIYQPFVTDTSVTFETEVPTVTNIAEKLTRTLQQLPWLVAEVASSQGAQVAGFAYTHRHRDRSAYQWAVELSVYVAETYRQCHVAEALYTALFAILRLQGYYRALAGIAQPNTASVCFHKAMGFTQVGVYSAVGFKRGEWHDVAWYELALQGKHLPPAGLPLPLPEVQDTRAFAAALHEAARIIRVTHMSD